MSGSVSFRASARTIDHLGKGQIADTPTAVSELWKNAYDAYARNVALHLFDGEVKCGAIIDNGCGMTIDQIINSWLVIGTSAKTKKEALPLDDRFGLPIRFTQGEKGIGRLSSAFLSPVTLLVTKKINSNYSAVLIDWRLFENHHLALDQITVPFESFDSRDDIGDITKKLIERLQSNFLDEDVDVLSGRNALSNLWDSYSRDEIQRAWDLNVSKDIKKNYENFQWLTANDDDLRLIRSEINQSIGKKLLTTKEKIQNFCESFTFDSNIAKSWFEFLDKASDLDGGEHGSALFLLDLNEELALITNRGDRGRGDFHLNSINNSLVETLKAFTDPYNTNKEVFDNEIKVFGSGLEETTILSDNEVWGIEEFNLLEHRIDGEIDGRGWFTGRVVAFGVDHGEVKFPPDVGFDRNRTEVGPFKIKIGTFEIDKAKSSHDLVMHENLSEQIKSNCGFYIFRDGLRVLPYGRSDNDFFEIEERRGKSAGTAFWASRRMTGHIFLNQINNSKLKDKAGREGFIKNDAARELKQLVTDLLQKLADKFFGGKSDARKKLIEILNKEKALRKAEQSKARKSSQKSFRDFLKLQTPHLEAKVNSARQLLALLQSAEYIDSRLIDDCYGTVVELEELRGGLKPPTKPPKVADGPLENLYRNYRDMYGEFSETVKSSRELINKHEARLSIRTPYEIAKRSFDSKQSMLNAQISRYEKRILAKLSDLEMNWKSEASTDRSMFHAEAISILDDINFETSIEAKLNSLDAIHVNLSDSFTLKYEAYLSALERLEQGVNLESAFSMAEEEREYFEKKASQLSALAQLGISVEVMAHEIEQQDILVTRGLNSLPADVKQHAGYQTAINAHKQLTDRIRFLSPLKLSGYQERRAITGKDIIAHVHKVFSNNFERQRIDFQVDEQFLKISIVDLPSRIYPVFVNIINNAMYWVSLAEKREIKIEVVGECIVIGNSGPAVDEDDVERLFQLFYSRRSSGHGVGLYLCKENLAVAYHQIWYAQSEDLMLFKDGANFVIKFNEMELVA